LVLGVELLGADAPVSFGADVPLSFDWAIETVVGAIIATNPPRIRAPQTVGTFMPDSKWRTSDNNRTLDRDRSGRQRIDRNKTERFRPPRRPSACVRVWRETREMSPALAAPYGDDPWRQPSWKQIRDSRREQGQDIGMPMARLECPEPLCLVMTALRFGSRSPRSARSSLEGFTGPREFGRDAFDVESGSVLVGMLIFGSVRRETALVDDMEEVTHMAGLGRRTAGFRCRT
jgi:hypothetical protein